MKSYKLIMHAPMYHKFTTATGGHLDSHKACHALFNYAVRAARIAINRKTEVVYEGEPDPTYNMAGLFRTIAEQYGVRPEEMEKFWLQVDMQMRALGLEVVPNTNEYRFHRWQGQRIN